MNATRAARRVVVTPDGDGVVSHAGSLLVAELADRLGFTKAASCAMAHLKKRSRRHDPGVILTQLAVMLVDGGDCLSDLGVLRTQQDLFGNVASHSTAWRTIASGWAKSAIEQARRSARDTAWAAGAAPSSITLDVDSTLVTAHSDKEDASPNYKRGYGFHPILVALDETEEMLAGMLRPGNAGANDASDHVVVIDEALSQLPGEYRAGHNDGDKEDEVMHEIVVRSDSAGATHQFVEACADRNLEVSIGMPIDWAIREALSYVQEEDWVPAIETDGEVRDGASVTELTSILDLTEWGGGRLICRRERPHPGAQLSLFDQEDGFRHQCFYTTSDGDAAALELRHRGHARMEDRIRAAKATGLSNLPFRDLCPNENWFALVLAAMDLVAWTKGICLEGDLRLAEPKRLRFTLLHVGARLVRNGRRLILRVQRSWPWAEQLDLAFRRLRLLTC
jgi:hypothetical protein